MCQGTGHGVGMYLNVHEGPIGINNRMVVQTHPLKAGMVVTDGESRRGARKHTRQTRADRRPISPHSPAEPGYYEAGSFGVRIENVVEVIDVATKVLVVVFGLGSASHRTQPQSPPPPPQLLVLCSITLVPSASSASVA